MNIQFKKGVLELCVLSLLEHNDRYGYELASSLSETIDISDGTNLKKIEERWICYNIFKREQ